LLRLHRRVRRLGRHRSSHCSATQSMDDPVTQVHTLWGALVGGPDLKDNHVDITKDYIYNEVTDDYNAGFCGDLAGLYHYYGRKGGKDAKENKLIENFDMSSNAKGYDQVDEKGNALPVGYYVAGAKAQEKEDGVQLKIVLHNRTVDPPKFECDVKARYFFNIKELQDKGYGIDYITARIDYDQVAGYSNNKSHATFAEPVKYDDKGTYYVEITWKDCKFYGSRVYQFALTTKMDPDKYIFPEWDSTNDYSYGDLVSFDDDNAAEAITDKITLYADGKLIWGTEPNGKTASDESENTDTYTAPKITSKNDVDGSSVKLSWTAVKGAEQYGIAGYQNGKWSLLGKSTGTSYTLSGLTEGKSYKVAVVTMIDKKWKQDYTNAITVIPKKPNTTDTNLYPEVKTQVKDGKIGFKWTKVTGAEKYAIGVYQANKWKVVKQFDSSVTSWTSPQVGSGKYRLVVLAKVNGKWVNADVFKKAFYVTVP
ncbi:glycoside hydrolase family 9 protein, partial [uncultured Ruminococcus sp.]|uniref:glycoside hydrolase family 9 protein n=1 Tax=uncultured Ruminococcus sp. TaxID=165186 RepID=UPI0025E9C190